MRHSNEIIIGIGLGLGVCLATACVDPYESRLNQKCFADEHCDDGQFCEKTEGADEGFCRKEGETMDASDSDPTMAEGSGTTDGSGSVSDSATTNPTDPTESTTTSTEATTNPTDPTDSSSSTSTSGQTDSGSDETTGGQSCRPSVASYGAADTYNTGPNPQGLAVGELDGDGSIDIVVSARDENAIYMWLNDGFGGFGPGGTHPINGSPAQVELAAIADATTDVVVEADVTQQFVRARGNGAGGFANNASYAGGGAFALGDVDGDDVIDLVAPGTDAIEVRLGSVADESFGNVISSPHAAGVGSIALGDLDGDGALDLATGHFGQVGISLGTGNGTFSAQPSPAVSGGVQAIGIGQLDDDGFADVAVVTAGGGTDALRILHGNGDGTFQATVEVLTAQTTPAALEVADLDADGDDDIVVASQGGTVSVYIQEAGGFAQPVNHNCNPNLFSLGVADLNDDCVLDIVTASSSTDTFCVFLSE